ncbi:hypothetical protein [Frankia sp. AgB1.9]|uniref:hypothetical protein n=1 Tax=Frankia sp. AgB1.9 TaxID=1836968 RepID=UPI0019349186|nr:hypothetical protein [Frankia sp. AgB1.9]
MSDEGAGEIQLGRVPGKCGWYWTMVYGARGSQAGDRLLPTTVDEARRLVNAVIALRPSTRERILRWSFWRRRHHITARISRHRHRGHQHNFYKTAAGGRGLDLPAG